MSNLRQKFVKGIFWSAIRSWGRQVISFIVFSLLARLLQPEAFGLVALAGVFLGFVQVFLNQGFAIAIVQRQELEPEHLDTAFWTNLGMGILLTIVGLFGAGLFADFYHQPELIPIVRWLSLSFIINSLSQVQNAILSRQFKFKIQAVRSLLAVFAGGLVGTGMAFMGYGVWSLVGQQLTNELVGVLVLWQASDWRPRLKISQRHFQELFSFGINIMGIDLLNFFNRRADDLLIGYFLGPVALGYYTVAYRLLLVSINLLTSITSNVSLTVFSKMQEQPTRMREAFYKAINLTSAIAIPAFTGLAVLAPEIVPVVFGQQWLPSVPVMQILAFIGILQAVFSFNGTVMMAMGKPSWKLKINCINAVCNVVSFVLVVRWGIIAVAAAYVIRGYLLAPIPVWAISKLLKIKISTYLHQYVAPLASSLVMVSAIWIVKYMLGNALNPHWQLTFYILLGAIAYGLAILFFAPIMYRQGINLVRSLINVGSKS